MKLARRVVGGPRRSGPPGDARAEILGHALLACVLALTTVLLAQSPALAGENPNQECIDCHNDPEMTVRFKSGERLSLFIDEAKFNASVHGDRLACLDCHPGMDQGDEHPKLQPPTRRAYAVAMYESCKKCHFDNYTKTLDSVHFSALREGKKDAPICSDCHSAHYAHKPGESRGKDSTACGECHEKIYQTYSASVHGKALLDEDNRDVPSCTTCHGVHNIGAARAAAFRLASTQLCSSCHEDEKLMKKYKLPANVLKTYLEDFHGRTVSFKQKQEVPANPNEPLCIDCHGFHDVKSAKDPNSPVLQANLQQTCQKCHKGASTTFPNAWMGHYEASLTRSPLVYLIRVWYLILIPVLIGGLLMHIGLDVWRLVKNR